MEIKSDRFCMWSHNAATLWLSPGFRKTSGVHLCMWRLGCMWTHLYANLVCVFSVKSGIDPSLFRLWCNEVCLCVWVSKTSSSMIHSSPVTLCVPLPHTHRHTNTHDSEDSHSYDDDTMDRRHSVSESLTPLQSGRDGHYSTLPCWLDITDSWKLGVQMDPSVSSVKEINLIISVFKYHSFLIYDWLSNS